MDQERRAVYVVDQTDGRNEVLEIFLGRDWEAVIRRARRYMEAYIRHTGHPVRLMEVDLVPSRAREHCLGQ